MSAYNDCFDREKAVRVSAELLCNTGVAFFPLDIEQLFESFRRQVSLKPYSSCKESSFDPLTLSKDGFCTRFQDLLTDFGTGPVNRNKWMIYYNDKSLDARYRFTVMHEMGHVLLGHHQLLNMDTLKGAEDDPEYRAADTQADQFCINALAPAPAVYRLLKEHGFSCSAKTGGTWKLTNTQAPFLRNLGKEPDAGQLVMTSFGLSQAAARRRLSELRDELEIWKGLDPELYKQIEGIAHRAGWYCWVCHTRRRTTSPYCPGCGKGWDYEYKDYGRLSRPVMGLRENGQFAFCSVCGNTEYTEDAAYCPVCGAPVINECENAYHTDGDFIRSGMLVIRGTHRCRPTDIYCGTCGVLTAFGAQHGPRKNMWLPGNKSERCRTQGTSYPSVFPSADGRNLKCPSCSQTYAPNDRYCRVCGKPTLLYKEGILPDYSETETFKALRRAEADIMKPHSIQLMIGSDGTMTILNQQAR